MHERIPDSDYQQLQYFISESDWDAQGLMMEVARRTQASLSGQRGEQGLILDESGWEKSGKKSAGVARQYIGQVGKVANGQVGVFAALTRGGLVGLAGARLYLPQEWTDDALRCMEAGVPLSAQQYQTKPELAAGLLAQLTQQGIVADWVGGDALYGNSPVLRQALTEAQQAFVMDVTPEMKAYLIDPSPLLTDKIRLKEKLADPRNAIRSVALAGVASILSAARWQQVTHRQGTKGPLTRQAALVKVWLWKPDRPKPPEQFWLLISREMDGTEVKFSLCYQPDGQVDLSVALARQMQRYFVERAFQDVKEQLGMHQYQVRSYKAWYHHIALTMMALHYILQARIELQEDWPLLSCPDVKLVIARSLVNKLDATQGVWEAIENRHRKRAADLLRRKHKT